MSMRQKTISAIVYIFAALHSMLACWVFIRDNGADYYNWDFDIVKAYVNPSDEYLFQFAVINKIGRAHRLNSSHIPLSRMPSSA